MAFLKSRISHTPVYQVTGNLPVASCLCICLSMYWKQFKSKIFASYLDCHCLALTLARRGRGFSQQLQSKWISFSVFGFSSKERCKGGMKGSLWENHWAGCKWWHLSRCMANSFAFTFPTQPMSLSSFVWWTVCSKCRDRDSAVPPPFLHTGSSHRSIDQVPTMYPALYSSILILRS